MCTTGFYPPLEKYFFASVRGLARNHSERPCLAARTLLLADFAILRSVVIFVKYCEVSTRTILPNFIDLSVETALHSRFGGGVGEKWGKAEAYGRQV